HISCNVSILLYSSAPSEIYTLSLHDALPILVFDTFERIISHDPEIAPSGYRAESSGPGPRSSSQYRGDHISFFRSSARRSRHSRSEEHTSELQSRENLVCRLLLEKKKTYI